NPGPSRDSPALRTAVEKGRARRQPVSVRAAAETESLQKIARRVALAREVALVKRVALPLVAAPQRVALAKALGNEGRPAAAARTQVFARLWVAACPIGQG